MGIYTHFGGMRTLIEAVVDDGFDRLATHMSAVDLSDDAARNMTALTIAFVEHARANPNLYRVMFGSAALGQFGPLDMEQVKRGRRRTLDITVSVIEAGTASGRFASGSAWRRATQWFAAVHGYTMLELSGYIRASDGVEKVLRPLLDAVVTGFATSAA